MNISVRIFSVKLISKSPLAPVVIDIFFYIPQDVNKKYGNVLSL